MDYRKCISKMNELYQKYIHFIDDEDDIEGNIQYFIDYIISENYQENSNEFKLILHLISNISSNHHRHPTFLKKTQDILSYFGEYITQNYKNTEIFNLFKKNKRILLFLIDKKIITMDESIKSLILLQDREKNQNFNRFHKDGSFFIKKTGIQHSRIFFKNYQYYFFPEIKPFLTINEQSTIQENLLKMDKNIFDNFENNRQKGENENYICELIRNDSIEDFIIYINKTNLSLTTRIPYSIFETNNFLINKSFTLIEYASFFGSIQIFRYLYMNGVKITSSLLIYTIHGNNPEMIHLLEEYNVEFSLESLKESIKCHHNSITNYILTQYMNENVMINLFNIFKNKIAYGFHYHNYEFIQNYDNIEYINIYACLYGYFKIVKLLVESNLVDIKKKVILKQIILISLK